MEYQCLIIDDEEELAEATCEYFEMFDLHADYVTNAKDALQYIEIHKIHIILLDINLKQDSGFYLCKELRKRVSIPIFFISARQSDDDVLLALNVGGDDYIKKPYSLAVLLAKVKAMLLRMESVRGSEAVNEHIFLDEKACKVLVDGNDAGLKMKEFRLFSYLYAHKNIVVTKDELFNNVWGDTYFSDGTLNVHIRKLREKIEKDPNHPELIKTVWGTGYMLEL